MVIKSTNQVMNERLLNKIRRIVDYIQFGIFEETHDPHLQNVTMILLDSTQISFKVNMADVSKLQKFLNQHYINYEVIRDFNFY